jgi:hypothetical protein
MQTYEYWCAVNYTTYSGDYVELMNCDDFYGMW